MARKARHAERLEFRRHKVYEDVPVKGCRDARGMPPMPVRWADTNNGDRDNPEYWSR